MARKSTRRKYLKKKHTKRGNSRKRERDKAVENNDVNYKIHRKWYL